MNLTCSSRLQCRSSARAHIATWRFCSAAFTALHNSSTRSLKFAYSPPVRPVISVQINAQACAQQPHSTKVKGPVSISLKNCNARWFFEDICQECQSWLYLPHPWFAGHLHLQSWTCWSRHWWVQLPLCQPFSFGPLPFLWLQGSFWGCPSINRLIKQKKFSEALGGE